MGRVGLRCTGRQRDERVPGACVRVRVRACVRQARFEVGTRACRTIFANILVHMRLETLSWPMTATQREKRHSHRSEPLRRSYTKRQPRWPTMMSMRRLESFETM